HFELEFYVRKLAKNGVKLVSITQEMGDDPMHVMMRQIMALFDEYQSKENAKHVMRALKENARQGFWNLRWKATEPPARWAPRTSSPTSTAAVSSPATAGVGALGRFIVS